MLRLEGILMNLLADKTIRNEFSLTCKYPEGFVINRENDICDKLGYIIKGDIGLIHYTSSGEERVLARLKANDFFGDFLINSKHPFYPGNLICLSETEIVFLNQKNLDRLIRENENFRSYYLNQLSDKALKLNYHNKVLLQGSLREKILLFLDQKALETNSKRIKISSKQTLANYLNVARPSLSRELSIMRKNGLIDYNRKEIIIK